MLTISSCGVKLQEVPLGLEKKAKTLDIHMHFLWLFSTFIHFFNFSTWGVIFQKLKENGVQTVKYIVDGEVWRQAYKMQTRVSKEPKYRGWDDEATKCRLCKHCGCMRNTDYI